MINPQTYGKSEDKIIKKEEKDVKFKSP